MTTGETLCGRRTLRWFRKAPLSTGPTETSGAESFRSSSTHRARSSLPGSPRALTTYIRNPFLPHHPLRIHNTGLSPKSLFLHYCWQRVSVRPRCIRPLQAC